MNFYCLRPLHIDDEIKIQAYTEYDTLDFLHWGSALIENNRFYVAEGSIVCDLVSFNDSANFAVSKRIRDKLLKNSITGFGLFPITIDGHNEDYFGFMNISEAGPILNLDELNNYETEHILFDRSSWDGSGIFHLKNSAINVVTQDVANLLLSENYSNIEISPL